MCWCVPGSDNCKSENSGAQLCFRLTAEIAVVILLRIIYSVIPLLPKPGLGMVIFQHERTNICTDFFRF